MSDFNHELGWNDVNREVDNLDKEIPKLYERVVVQCEAMSQNAVLGMDWPSREHLSHRLYEAQTGKTEISLHDAFARINRHDLAKASWLIYHWGHWSPMRHSYVGKGATWKFSLYSDQILEENIQKFIDGFGVKIADGSIEEAGKPFFGKLKTKEDFDTKYRQSGRWLEVHQGVLRLTEYTLATKLVATSLSWHEVCLSSVDNFELCCIDAFIDGKTIEDMKARYRKDDFAVFSQYGYKVAV